jgi:hypothetical protein
MQKTIRSTYRLEATIPKRTNGVLVSVRRCSGVVVLGKVLKEMAEGDARPRSSLTDQAFFFLNRNDWPKFQLLSACSVRYVLSLSRPIFNMPFNATIKTTSSRRKRRSAERKRRKERGRAGGWGYNDEEKLIHISGVEAMQ